MKRVLALAVALTIALVALAAVDAQAKKVIVLGFDGLDPDRVRDMIDDGRLPNMARMAKTGQLADLGTSIPPQSRIVSSLPTSSRSPSS